MENKFLCVTGLKMRHCCVEKGVLAEIEVEQKITSEHYKKISENEKVKNFFIYRDNGSTGQDESGFVRFYFDGSAVLSFVLNSHKMTIMYSYRALARLHQNIEEILPGFNKNFVKLAGEDFLQNYQKSMN